jgi:N-acetylneuraminic acid mutarotase
MLQVSDSTGAVVNSIATNVTVNINKITVTVPASMSSPSPNPTAVNAPTSTSSPNSWTSEAPMSTAEGGYGTAVLNGIIYVIGSSTTYAYNPVINTWTSKAPMITPRTSFAVAAFNNWIYVIGGSEENSELPCSVNEVYDPSTNTWATAAAMPTARMEMQADTVNGKIYVMGGSLAQTTGELNFTVSTTEIYDPATDSWSTGASMPYPVYQAASAVVDNNIYVIGGQDPSLFSRQNLNAQNVQFNQIYNPATNSWRLGAPIPAIALSSGAGATTGVLAPERIYVFGSITPAVYLGASNQNYAYDPTTNSWASGAPMPYACAGPAVAVVNDLLYIMGDGQNVEQYTPVGYTSPTTVTATADSNATVNLTINGNITNTQMSNVTITTNQSNTTTSVSFTVTGESGTTGFSNITMPKSAVPYGTAPTVYIDGQPAQNQGSTQDSSNYYVWYTTHFSTHQISIVFTSSSVPEFQSLIILQLLVISLVGTSLLVYFRRRGHKTAFFGK